MNEAGRRRLDSWKEIADYVGHDVRTAIRWEHERGLPVHRVPGGKRGSVFALTDEIDRWLLAAEVDNGMQSGARTTADAVAAPGPGRLENGSRKRLSRARWIAVVVAGGILLAAVATLLSAYADRKRSGRAPAAAISLAGTELVAFDQKHEVLWRHDFGRQVVAAEDPPDELPPRLFVSADDLDGDGLADVLLSVRFGTTMLSRGELFAFSARGRVLWSHALENAVTFGSGKFLAPWHDLAERDTGSQVAAFEVDGQRRIAWVQAHHTWWPSILTVLDAAGRPLSKWVHSGLIYTMVPMESPGGARLLTGGVSNSREAAFFAVLDAHHLDGAGPEERGSPYECLSCGPGRPLRYFTVQPSEQMLTSAPYNHVLDIRPGEDGIEVRSRDGPMGTFAVQAVLRFSLDFTLEHAAWSSAWAAGHRELERLGKLDHTVAECSERDRPPHVREWTPDGGWRDLTPPIAAASGR